MAIGSENVVARIRRMLAEISEKTRRSNETRYTPPVIWRNGMRLQRSLRRLRPAEVRVDPRGRVIGRDQGRPKEMSGRQWKRLKRAEHMLAQVRRETVQEYGGTQSLQNHSMATMAECQRRISRAHASCDRPDTGHPYIGGRRLRTTIEL